MLLKVAFNTNKHITLVMRDLFYFRKSVEGQQQRLERTLEEFYSLCDQVEVNLVIIFILSKLSSCFTIFAFQSHKTSIPWKLH